MSFVRIDQVMICVIFLAMICVLCVDLSNVLRIITLFRYSSDGLLLFEDYLDCKGKTIEIIILQ